MGCALSTPVTTIEQATRRLGRHPLPSAVGEVLHDLARHGDVAVYQNVVSIYGETATVNSRNETPLFTALRARQKAMAAALAPRYLDDATSRVGARGYTALHLAVVAGFVDIVAQLVERDADTARATQRGHTPLTLAIDANNLEMVTALVARGADPALITPGHKSPMAHAAVKGRVNILTYFLVSAGRAEVVHALDAARRAAGGTKTPAVALLAGHLAKM